MFWRFHLPTSNIDTILDKEDVTLQELMDEDDVLQECKGQNRKLVDFLVKQEVMEEMVGMVITEPSDDTDEKSRFKYPNTACELLTSDVQMITDKLAGEVALVKRLYSFLENEEPLNPLLASFVSKIMGLLISRKPEFIFQFLKEKDGFVERLLFHLGTSAIMDLLLRLITCIEVNDVKISVLQWLNSERLIHRLAKLIHHLQDENKHCNAAQSLCDIVRLGRDQMCQMQEKAEPDALLEAVESTEAISELLSNMFEGEATESVITSGISVLLTLLEKKRPGMILEMEPDTTELDAERYESSVDRTVQAVVPRLTDFHNLLVNPPKQMYSTMPTTVGVLTPPLGNTRLQVAKLLSKLVQTQRAVIAQTLANLGTLPVLVDLFFQYEWNSFMHGQVYQLLVAVMTFPQEQSAGDADNTVARANPLLTQLLESCGLLQRILKEWEDNEDYQSRPGCHRRGFMGHLTKIANETVEQLDKGSNSQVMKELIDALEEEVREDWSTFVSGTLADINKKNTADRVGMAGFSSSEEDDREFESLPFPQDTSLQQAFCDYQVQQMTSTFTEQFGFSAEDFGEQEGTLDAPFTNRLSSIDFNINAGEQSQASSMFEQACQERLHKFDDTEDSDEDIWEEKEITFANTQDSLASALQATGSSTSSGRLQGAAGSDDADSGSSSDSEEDLSSPTVIRPRTSSPPPGEEQAQASMAAQLQEKMDTEEAGETSASTAMEEAMDTEQKPPAQPSEAWTKDPAKKDVDGDEEWADFRSAPVSSSTPATARQEPAAAAAAEDTEAMEAEEDSAREKWADFTEFAKITKAEEEKNEASPQAMDTQEPQPNRGSAYVVGDVEDVGDEGASDTKPEQKEEKKSAYPDTQMQTEEEPVPGKPAEKECTKSKDSAPEESPDRDSESPSETPKTPPGSPVGPEDVVTVPDVVVQPVTVPESASAPDSATAPPQTEQDGEKKEEEQQAGKEEEKKDIDAAKVNNTDEASSTSVAKPSPGLVFPLDDEDEDLEDNFAFLASAGLMGDKKESTDAAPNGPDGSPSDDKLEKLRAEAKAAAAEFEATTGTPKQNGPA